MRTKDVLFSFDEVTTLVQYLYLDEQHSIRIANGATTLQIHMTDQMRFIADNLSFPDIPAMDYTGAMTLPAIMRVIKQLKMQPPEEFPNQFPNRWEEIENITDANVSLNHFNRR